MLSECCLANCGLSGRGAWPDHYRVSSNCTKLGIIDGLPVLARAGQRYKCATEKESMFLSPVGQLMKKTAFLNELSELQATSAPPSKEADIQLQCSHRTPNVARQSHNDRLWNAPTLAPSKQEPLIAKVSGPCLRRHDRDRTAPSSRSVTTGAVLASAPPIRR